ncbi:MAG TPA: Ig-like domain-containing protein, partial [Planctomycetota bacterium]|nr:Ig-like domain-containing protein [Planctomycetota bacterium]
MSARSAFLSVALLAATPSVAFPQDGLQTHSPGGGYPPGFSPTELSQTLQKILHPDNVVAATVNPSPSWIGAIPPGATGFEVQLSPAETGVVFNGQSYSETFGIMLPAGYDPQHPPPLVVAWHGSGNSHAQIFFSTLIPSQANARGWMVMAPLGIADNTFGWLPGQQAVEKSIDWVRANYPFDESRVYALGFSGGAQAVGNFVARHMDPNWIRFAALGTVAGAFDVAQVYLVNEGNPDPSIQLLLQLMQVIFGGNPHTLSFEYERVSIERMPATITNPIMPVEGHTMARSLVTVPCYIAWSTDDTVVPWVDGNNRAFKNYLITLGSTPVTQPVSGSPTPHSWGILDYNACFNFFASKSLAPHPQKFTILADRDARFHDVTISGGTTGDFRRFDFEATATAPATLHVTASSNVSTYRVDASGLAFSTATDFHVATATTDSTGDSVIVEDCAAPPSKVWVDGTDNYGWKFDLGASTTRVDAPSGTHDVAVLYDTFDLDLDVTGRPYTGGTVTFDLTGGAPGEAYAICYSLTAGLFPLSFIDGDPRWLLLDLFSLNAPYAGNLGPAGDVHPPLTIPNVPSFVGISIPFQAFTAPGAPAGIPYIVGRISNRAVIAFEAANVSPSLSLAIASPSTGVVADGSQGSTISVTVLDASGDPLQGQSVSISATGTGNTLTQPSGSTNASGVATATLASTKAETKSISVTVNPGPASVLLATTPAVAFIGDVTTLSPSLSTAVASPGVDVVANGTATSTVTVTVVDANGNPLAGQTVQIAASGTDNTVTQPSGPTNASGVATASIASTRAETKTITVTVNPSGTAVVLAATPTVAFIGDATNLSPSLSTAVSSPAVDVVADGVATSTITITVKDAHGNAVAGQTVQVAASGTDNTITQPSGPTNPSGIATATISSTRAETKTITVTVNPSGTAVV